SLFVGGALVLVTAFLWLLVTSGVPIGNADVFYFPIVILATLLLNWQIAVLALVAATLFSDYFLTPPLYQIGAAGWDEIAADRRFIAANGWIIGITARLKQARPAAERLAHENGALFQQEAEARRATELFLGVLSHDLHTPLTVMKGMVQ